MNRVEHLVEAAVYVDDLDQAEAFYRDVLGLELIAKEAGRHVFFRAGQSVLLVFNPEATMKGGEPRERMRNLQRQADRVCTLIAFPSLHTSPR